MLHGPRNTKGEILVTRVLDFQGCLLLLLENNIGGLDSAIKLHMWHLCCQTYGIAAM